MKRYMAWGLMLLVPMAIMATTARGQDSPTVKMAQDILDKGSALFDTRDAGAMAATYAVDGELILYTKDQSSGEYKPDVRRGRAAIEAGYKQIFDDRSPGAKSKNTVEAAHMVGDDILLIHGTFKVDVSQSLTVQCLQTRARQDGKWLVLNMQIFAANE